MAAGRLLLASSGPRVNAWVNTLHAMCGRANGAMAADQGRWGESGSRGLCARARPEERRARSNSAWWPCALRCAARCRSIAALALASRLSWTAPPLRWAWLERLSPVPTRMRATRGGSDPATPSFSARAETGTPMRLSEIAPFAQPEPLTANRYVLRDDRPQVPRVRSRGPGHGNKHTGRDRDRPGADRLPAGERARDVRCVRRQARAQRRATDGSVATSARRASRRVAHPIHATRLAGSAAG